MLSANLYLIIISYHRPIFEIILIPLQFVHFYLSLFLNIDLDMHLSIGSPICFPLTDTCSMFLSIRRYFSDSYLINSFIIPPGSDDLLFFSVFMPFFLFRYLSLSVYLLHVKLSLYRFPSIYLSKKTYDSVQRKEILESNRKMGGDYIFNQNSTIQQRLTLTINFVIYSKYPTASCKGTSHPQYFLNIHGASIKEMETKVRSHGSSSKSGVLIHLKFHKRPGHYSPR